MVLINMREVEFNLMKWKWRAICDGCQNTVAEHDEIKPECSAFFLDLLIRTKREELITSNADILRKNQVPSTLFLFLKFYKIPHKDREVRGCY